MRYIKAEEKKPTEFYLLGTGSQPGGYGKGMDVLFIPFPVWGFGLYFLIWHVDQLNHCEL